MKRLENKFLELKQQKRAAFVAYICAGHPDYQNSLEILKIMPQSGVDVIELGVPFLDPAGDGPIIENAAKLAIANGMTLKKTLQMVEEFRKTNQTTPIILMGYYNPFLKYGLDKIFFDLEKSGVDGCLIVDLPLEERAEIKNQISQTNVDLIGLIAPTTSEARAKEISKNSSGFLYMVSMLGITGTKSADLLENKKNLQKLQQVSDLPIAIGFGIKTSNQAQEFAQIGVDAVVVGSEIVKKIDENFLQQKTTTEIVENLSKQLKDFSSAIKLTK